jgi:hypothetical protein
MNEYDEAFHRTVVEAMGRAKERAAELKARAAEAKVRSEHICAQSRTMQDQALHERLSRST